MCRLGPGPKKCCGKNIKFAPTNIVMKCKRPVNSQIGLPVIFGNHK